MMRSAKKNITWLAKSNNMQSAKNNNISPKKTIQGQQKVII